MLNRRYEDEIYKDHQIRIYAERIDAESAWTIEIHVQAPDGTHLPSIKDNDHSYTNLAIAFTTGSQMGRNLVDS